MSILQHGDETDYATLQMQEPTFPHGRDSVFGSYWLTNAIEYEAVKAIRWMVGQNINLSYLDDEGITPLTAALDCKIEENRYALLRLMLAQGARHDTIGSNCFTAAHLAALRNDVEALRILKEYGADLCVATEDLGSWRTPADVARFHQCHAALEYLEQVCQGAANKLCRPEEY